MTDSDEPTFASFERAGWEDASVAAKYHEHLATVTNQSIGALLDAAGVGEADRVLDVATGAGYVAAAAAVLGADAIGVDFSNAQVAQARARYPRVRFERADALALPFDDGAFDAVVNAFGMCHVPDPDAALVEAFRVLRPGGRVAFSVWDVPARAVGLGAPYDAIRAHGSLDIALPAGPDFFLLSDPAESEAALARAGFHAPTCRLVHQTWHLSRPDEVYESVAAGTVRAGATLRAQTPEARDAIRAALRARILEFESGGFYDVPMPALIASGVKPE